LCWDGGYPIHFSKSDWIWNSAIKSTQNQIKSFVIRPRRSIDKKRLPATAKTPEKKLKTYYVAKFGFSHILSSMSDEDTCPIPKSVDGFAKSALVIRLPSAVGGLSTCC